MVDKRDLLRDPLRRSPGRGHTCEARGEFEKRVHVGEFISAERKLGSPTFTTKEMKGRSCREAHCGSHCQVLPNGRNVEKELHGPVHYSPVQNSSGRGF